MNKLACQIVKIGMLMSLVLGAGNWLYAEGVTVPIHVNVQCTISFTASQSTISLSFSDFKPGTISNMEQITYTITGNAVSKTQDIILVRMDDTFNGIEVQSEMGGYSTVAGNAHLESSNAGYVTISTVDTGIANKVTDSGDGLLLDGNFPISYRANITQTQPAGQQTRTVIVTFAHH